MENEPNLPVAISYVGQKYLVFDIDVVTWVRRVHHICGVMTGTLPQSPSQNLFLGLPVQMMPEEAQLLVEKGVAYIVDDARAHDQALRNNDTSSKAAYLAQIRRKGERVSVAREEEKEAAKRQSLKQLKNKSNSKSKKESPSAPTDSSAEPEGLNGQSTTVQAEGDADTSLFDSSATTKPTNPKSSTSLPLHAIVPTTSNFWLPSPPTTPPSSSESRALLPNVPSSYALYKHLNSKSYFITPGLRFGCQYCVYPGDPLRFHSHFLAVGKEWDEEIDLMDIVGGGRLGTGVKKGFLIGGLEPGGKEEKSDGETSQEKVRTFSVEWAVM